MIPAILGASVRLAFIFPVSWVSPIEPSTCCPETVGFGRPEYGEARRMSPALVSIADRPFSMLSKTGLIMDAFDRKSFLFSMSWGSLIGSSVSAAAVPVVCSFVKAEGGAIRNCGTSFGAVAASLASTADSMPVGADLGR